MSRRRNGCLACGCLGVPLAAVGVLVLAVLAVPLGFRGAAALREVDDAHEVAPGTWVDVDGLAVHVQRWDGGDAGTLVLVPGTSAWAETWVEVAEPLSQAGYDVVALDLPPFGYTDRPVDGSYDRPSQAARIHGVIQALDLDDVVLMGHSFGGGATVETAMRYPDRLSHLILLDVALGLGKTPTEAPPGPLAEVIVAMTMSNPWFTRTGVQVMVADPSAVTETRVERYRTPLTVTGTTSAIAGWLPELAAPAPSWAAEEDRYAGIALPTTVIWGAADTATPLAQGEHLVALIPNAELVVLDGVGHLPQIEDPAGVVAAVRTALDP